jgi:hypothetical protein
VIALDGWQRDYFRASYLLMPRAVWPYRQDPAHGPATALALRAAMTLHHATCLLAGAGIGVPSDVARVTGGAYSLYVLRGVAAS